MLKEKSITQLRGIAQGMGIALDLSMDKTMLLQQIELARTGNTPAPAPLPPRPEYDARMMTLEPAAMGSESELRDLLQSHISRGLLLSFPEPEQWLMQCGKKQDSGSMRQPLRVIMGCAESVLKP